MFQNHLLKSIMDEGKSEWEECETGKYKELCSLFSFKYRLIKENHAINF